jgi:hypothetical protein
MTDRIGIVRRRRARVDPLERKTYRVQDINLNPEAVQVLLECGRREEPLLAGADEEDLYTEATATVS